jgi:lysophospholipase L1-like esterase
MRTKFAHIIVALAVGLCAPVSRAAEAFVIKNGAMTQGDGVPDEWAGKFGEAETARDTAVFKEAPASLRVTVRGGKSGSAFQSFARKGGGKIRIAGWLKTSGSVKAQAAVHAFAEGFKQNQFLQLHFAEGETEWAQFEKEVELPEWTDFFHVMLLADGDGTAWLDEVREASGKVDPGTVKTPEERMTSSPPAAAKPWEPGWGFYPDAPMNWQSHFQSQLERTRKGGVNVVFIGDSITQGWGDTGKAAWTQHFEPLGAVNYGIGGDSTRQVLWRIQHGLLDGLQPKLVVLKIGTNNLYGDFNAGTDEEIARGIEASVQAIRAKLPQTRVLLLGILPRQNEYFSGRILLINALAQKLANGQAVRFLDLSERFQKTPGKGDLRTDLFSPDLLHLAAPGYAAFAEAIAPVVKEMIE